MESFSEFYTQKIFFTLLLFNKNVIIFQIQLRMPMPIESKELNNFTVEHLHAINSYVQRGRHEVALQVLTLGVAVVATAAKIAQASPLEGFFTVGTSVLTVGTAFCAFFVHQSRKRAAENDLRLIEAFGNKKQHDLTQEATDIELRKSRNELWVFSSAALCVPFIGSLGILVAVTALWWSDNSSKPAKTARFERQSMVKSLKPNTEQVVKREISSAHELSHSDHHSTPPSIRVRKM